VLTEVVKGTEMRASSDVESSFDLSELFHLLKTTASQTGIEFSSFLKLIPPIMESLEQRFSFWNLLMKLCEIHKNM
jgi:hypothetical protein